MLIFLIEKLFKAELVGFSLKLRTFIDELDEKPQKIIYLMVEFQ